MDNQPGWVPWNGFKVITDKHLLPGDMFLLPMLSKEDEVAIENDALLEALADIGTGAEVGGDPFPEPMAKEPMTTGKVNTSILDLLKVKPFTGAPVSSVIAVDPHEEIAAMHPEIPEDSELLQAAKDLGIDFSATLTPSTDDFGGFEVDDIEYDPDDDVFFDAEPDVVAPKVGKKAKKNKAEKKPKEKTFKSDKMVNGFMLQSNPLAEGKEPFYMESYLLGKDEFYITGGMSGTLNLEEMKELRKRIKFLINQMKESYPDAEKNEKGGKAILKVTAPWIPTEGQTETVKQIVAKEIAKVEAKETDLDPAAFVTELVTTVLSQVLYQPHTEDTLVPPNEAPQTVTLVGNNTGDPGDEVTKG